MLRGLAVSIEPLDDIPPSPLGTPSSTNTATNASTSGVHNKKLFLLEPTTVSAQAFVVSRFAPRPPPLAPGMGSVGGTAVDGAGRGSGGGAGGNAAVRAVSISGKAWRTLRPSLLQNLPNLMRHWAQVSWGGGVFARLGGGGGGGRRMA